MSIRKEITTKNMRANWVPDSSVPEADRDCRQAHGTRVNAIRGSNKADRTTRETVREASKQDERRERIGMTQQEGQEEKLASGGPRQLRDVPFSGDSAPEFQ